MTTAEGTRTFAIGKFDGLHLAHQKILKLAVSRANQNGSSPCMFTFTPHPRFALTGDPAYSRWLTPPVERGMLARSMGIQEVYVANFDTAFRAQSAEEFIQDYLVPLHAVHLVVGYNFRFGKGGVCGAPELAQIAGQAGIAVDIVPSILAEQAPVSSSAIRALLGNGEVRQVTRLLGRPYSFRGRVVRGDQRGRTIGFPTANLELLEPFVIPMEGVYVVRCQALDGVFLGMMNIGHRPTVYKHGELSLEVHLLDFNAEIYDANIEIQCLDYIRPERAFTSLEALKDQLAQDLSIAKNWRD